MADETDDPIDRLEQSLEELDEDGELDSDEISFRTTMLGGVHLDQLDEELADIDYDKDPVRITIEPELDEPSDHRYQVHFEYLQHSPDGYVSDTRQSRMDVLEEHLREHDALVSSEVHESTDIGRVGGTLLFEVEAEIVTVDGQGRDHTEYQIPRDIIELVQDFGGELEDVALYPDGRGLRKPTYALEVVVE